MALLCRLAYLCAFFSKKEIDRNKQTPPRMLQRCRSIYFAGQLDRGSLHSGEMKAPNTANATITLNDHVKDSTICLLHASIILPLFGTLTLSILLRSSHHFHCDLPMLNPCNHHVNPEHSLPFRSFTKINQLEEGDWGQGYLVPCCCTRTEGWL